MVDSGTFKTTSYLQESDVFQGAKAGVLLSNTRKEEQFKEASALAARRGIDPSSDLGKLDICFGGFSPTAMGGDMEALKQLAESVEKRNMDLREAKKRAQEVEAARASEQRQFTENGTTWKYVVLDDSDIRIERCETDSATLAIPDEIECKPVMAVAADACANLDSVESATMPNTVVSIGFGAFRDCANLSSIRFSDALAKFDPGWIKGCQRLAHIKLPGKMEKITSAVFDIPGLESLEIGEAVSEVMPGAFQKSKLQEINVNERNPFIASDGKALYSRDGSILVALAVPVEKYEVADGCVAIGKKGFSCFECIQNVVLPDTVEIVGDYAYMHASIRLFKAPSALRVIGERAFFACRELRTVILNEGLEAIGTNAFSDTSVGELRLPTSIRHLGNPIAEGTSLTYSGPNATFTIGKASIGADIDPELENAAVEGQHLILDNDGGLYSKEDDGLHLVRMLEPSATEYEVREGAVSIDEGAFAKHPSIVQVYLPPTLKRIEKGAFKDARNLADIELPSSLEFLGEEAFFDTSLQRLSIPASLVKIGEKALITYGAHHGNTEPSLRHIEVAKENPKFYMSSGLLIEKMDGLDRVLLCTGEEADVVVPDAVKAIAAYAFHGVRTLKTLTLSDRITMVEIRGLAFDCMVENVHVDLVEPIEGHASFDFRFPNTSRGFHQMGHAFGTPNFVNVQAMFDHYDNAIVNRSGFDGSSDGNQLSPYEQAQRIIDRLNDPVLMSVTNRNLMDGVLSKHLEEICVDAARHDDKLVIEGLLELGYITEDNLAGVIEAVGAVQDASITNYLLEQKRQRFGQGAIDFSL